MIVLAQIADFHKAPDNVKQSELLRTLVIALDNNSFFTEKLSLNPRNDYE